MKGAKIGLDHFLVRTKFRARILTKNKVTAGTSKQHHINALKQLTVAQGYEDRLCEALSQIDVTSLSVDCWNQVFQAVTSAVFQALEKA